MSDWLRWPRLWYATPTFVLFIALQAPDWRFTGRVYAALLVWAMLGVAIDVWMTRHQRQPPAASRQQDIRRLMNGGAVVGFILGICGLAFQPATTSAANGAWVLATGDMSSSMVLNMALVRLGILLPGLDIFHRQLLEMGRFDYAAYLGSFFVLVVVTWVVGYFLFYRVFAGLASSEFAKAVAAKKNYGRGPYGETQQKLALKGLRLTAVLLPIMLLLFGRVLPIDASHSVQAGRAYIALGIFGWAINILIYFFHSCRRFLSTLNGGLLPGGESESA
jgi:hypothetical protein